MNDSIYISSDDETPATKKAKEEDEIRNGYNIWKAPRGGHWLSIALVNSSTKARICTTAFVV